MDIRRRDLVAFLGWPMLAKPFEVEPSPALVAFRSGKFREALNIADATLVTDSENVAAILTKTRIYDANFLTDLAEAEFEKALSIAGGDISALTALPELSFAERRPVLLQRYVQNQLHFGSNSYHRARGLSLWLERTAPGRLCQAEELPTKSSCSLRRMRTAPGHSGLLGVNVRVNGNRPIAFQINSSALGLWLRPEMARRLGVVRLAEGRISEPGMHGSMQGALGFATQIEVAGVTFRSVPVFEAIGGPFDIQDGFIGIATFRDLLTRISLPELVLEFKAIVSPPTHVPGHRDVPLALEAGIKCLRSRHLLLVPGYLDRKDSLMLLQLQSEATVKHQPTPITSDSIPLWTGFSCRGPKEIYSAQVDVGTVSYSGPTYHCDMAETTTKVGIPTAGVIGVELLRGRTVTIDQRHGLVVLN